MRVKRKHKAGMSRRRFLQGLSAGTIATIVAGSERFSGTASAQSKATTTGQSVQIGRSHLPVLRRGDVIIVGGSIAAVAAALRFAGLGHKVVLVEHRNYLGREIAATLKPWVDLGKLTDFNSVPEPLAACLRRINTARRLPGRGAYFKLAEDSRAQHRR